MHSIHHSNFVLLFLRWMWRDHVLRDSLMWNCKKYTVIRLLKQYFATFVLTWLWCMMRYDFKFVFYFASFIPIFIKSCAEKKNHVLQLNSPESIGYIWIHFWSKIRSVFNTSTRYFHILLYNIKYISNTSS